jgi:hypothetical protein
LLSTFESAVRQNRRLADRTGELAASRQELAVKIQQVELAHELEAMQTGMRDLRRQVEMLLAQTSDTSAEDGA